VGKPIDHLSLRFRLSDFAYEKLAQEEIGDDDRELVISAQQLCDCLDAAEAIPLASRFATGRRHPQIKSLRTTKQSMLSKKRELRSVWQRVIPTMSMRQSRARQSKNYTEALMRLFVHIFSAKGALHGSYF